MTAGVRTGSHNTFAARGSPEKVECREGGPLDALLGEKAVWNTAQTINKLRRCFQSIPATCAPESCFFHQCAHWFRKQTRKSVRRPEIREDFRRTKILSLRIEKTAGFFDALSRVERGFFA